MNKRRYRKDEITQALDLHKAGASPADICRSMGVSRRTFDRWKAKIEVPDDPDAPPLKTLKIENAYLLRMLSQRDKEIEALRVLLRKESTADEFG